MGNQPDGVMMQYNFRRKKKSKIALGIVKAGLLIVATTVLAGCEGNAESPNNITPITNNTTTTITTSTVSKTENTEPTLSMMSNSQADLQETLKQLDLLVKQGKIDSSFTDSLTSICNKLHEIELELNEDNVGTIKKLITSVETSIDNIDLSKVKDADKALIEEISATTSRIREKANLLISQTGSGGTLEEQIDNYIEATQEIADSEKEPVESEETSKPSSTSKTEVSKPTETTKPVQTTTSTYTVDDDDIEEVVVAPVTSSDVKTIGGYAPTTPNEAYRNAGFKFWNMGTGIIFREGEMKDLRNWVEAGYTVEREVDPRIESRKGGIDNPRQFVLLGEDNNEAGTNNIRTDLLTLVTVYTGEWGADNKVDQEFVDLMNGVKYWLDGNKPDTTDAAKEYMSNHDIEKDLDLCPGDTLSGDGRPCVTYSYRNYCDEAINIDLRGEGVKHSYINYNQDGSVFETGAVAGVDFILTCDEDPEAFKLITGEDSKNYYYTRQIQGVYYSEMSSLYYESPNYVPNEDGTLQYRNNYVGVKPGIYNCTITIKSTGDKIPIVIENLPYHYENLQWGCTSQREMDACVAYMQFSEWGVNGQFQHTMMQHQCPSYMDVQLNAATVQDKLEILDEFNEKGLKTFEGDTIQLKRTAEAAEWLAHLPSVYTRDYFQHGARAGVYTQLAWMYTGDYYKGGKSCTSYDALDTIMLGANDCESITSVMTCMYNVLGYTTQQWCGSNHTWFEVKIPAAITQSGEDMWLMVDDGAIVGGRGSTAVKTYKGEYSEGFDTSWWGKCFNEDISNWKNMGVFEQFESDNAKDYYENEAKSMFFLTG